MNDLTKRLAFEEKSHRYTVDGVTLPSVTEIISPLTYSKYSVGTNVLEQAALRGTMVHELTASYDLGELEDEQIDVSFAPYLQAWKAFCHDYQPKFHYVELPLANRQFAGTVDRIAEIDGEWVVIDIKCYGGAMSREQKVAVATQLTGYCKLAWFNDIPVMRSSSRYVHLKKDGTYATQTVQEIEEKYWKGDMIMPDADITFLQCYRLYRLAKGGKEIV